MPRKPSFIETMTDDELDAHLVSLGFRVVMRVPSDPALLTTEHALALFAGDVEGALRDFYAGLPAVPARTA